MYADIFGTIPVAEALLSKVQSWNNFIIYDGSNNIKSAVFDHAEKAVNQNYWYYLLGYARQGLSLFGYTFNIFSAVFI